MLVGGAVPPIAPAKETVPVPACKVRVVAPLIVLVKLIPAPAVAPPVVLKSGVAVIETGPVIVMRPLFVVTLAPLILMAVDPV